MPSAARGIDSGSKAGRFEIRTRANTTDLMLTVHAGGHVAVLRTIPPLAPGERAEVEVPLKPETRVRGRLKDPRGEPIRDAILYAYLAPKVVLIGHSCSDKDGAFSVPYTEPGRDYVLYIGHSDHPGWMFQGANTDKELDIEIPNNVTIRGRLVGDRTRFPNTRVRLTGDFSTGIRRTESFADVDEETGRFEFPNQEVGMYRLEVESDDLAFLSRDDIEITKHSGDIEVQIPITPGVGVRGRIVEQGTERPIAGARRAVADMDRAGGFHGERGPPAMSGADGAFVLTRQPKDALIPLTVTADGYPRTTIAVKVPATGVTVELGRAASLVASWITPTGQSDRGIAVTVQWRENDSTSRVDPDATTARLDNLKPGRATLTVSSADASGQSFSESIELVAGETLTRRFEAGDGPRVWGKITGEHAWFYHSYRARTYLVDDPRDVRDYVVDADFQYDFRGLAPGERVLTVEGSSLDTQFRAAKVFTLSANQDLELDIEVPGGGIKGHVRDADGEAVPGARVSLFAADANDARAWERQPPLACEVAGDGSFTLIGAGLGSYALECTAPGFETLTRPQEIADAARPTPIELTLAREAVLHVRCHDDGGPTSGAVVVATRSDEGSVARDRRAVADERGETTLRSLTAGAWSITVSEPDRFPFVDRRDVSAGEAVEVDAALRRVGDLELTLRDASGLALAGAPVELRDRLDGSTASDWLAAGHIETSTGTLSTDDRGRLIIHRLPADTLDVLWAGPSQSVRVELADTVRQTLQALGP